MESLLKKAQKWRRKLDASVAQVDASAELPADRKAGAR
jgi:hypothetical protein